MTDRAINRPREVLSVEVSRHGVAHMQSYRDGPTVSVIARNFWGGDLAHVVLTLDEARQMLRGLDEEIALAGKRTAKRKLTTQQGDHDGDL